jgi:hypothetical protein
MRGIRLSSCRPGRLTQDTAFPRWGSTPRRLTPKRTSTSSLGTSRAISADVRSDRAGLGQHLREASDERLVVAEGDDIACEGVWALCDGGRPRGQRRTLPGCGGSCPASSSRPFRAEVQVDPDEQEGEGARLEGGEVRTAIEAVEPLLHVRQLDQGADAGKEEGGPQPALAPWVGLASRSTPRRRRRPLGCRVPHLRRRTG